MIITKQPQSLLQLIEELADMLIYSLLSQMFSDWLTEFLDPLV